MLQFSRKTATLGTVPNVLVFTCRYKKYSTSQKRVWGFKPSLIYSELRDPFVTIVTESAFSVTSIVTITNHPTYSLIVDLSMSRAKEE